LDSVEDYAALHIHEGPSAAVNRNRGALNGEAAWISFLDDDVRLPPGWLREVESVLAQDPPYDIFSGLIGSTRPQNVYSQAAEDFVIRHKKYGAEWFLVGAMLFVRRSAFQAIGGFNESFPGAGGEDWDFCSRAHHLHLRVGVIDSITCKHANPTTFAELMRRATSYGSSEPQSSSPADADAPPTNEVTGNMSLLFRGAIWPAREYLSLRSRGRTHSRSFVSTALYVPWMARYLWARRSNVAP